MYIAGGGKIVNVQVPVCIKIILNMVSGGKALANREALRAISCVYLASG